MYTKQALRELGLTGTELTAGQMHQLGEDGIFIVENYYSRAEAAAMAAEFDRLHAIEGASGGHEVHVEPGAPRVSNIFNKTGAYDRCLACKPVLAAAHHMLGEFKLHGGNLRPAQRFLLDIEPISEAQRSAAMGAARREGDHKSWWN